MGQGPGGRRGHIRQTAEGERILDGGGISLSPGVGSGCGDDLSNLERGRQLRCLKGAGEACARDVMGCEVGNHATCEMHGPGVGRYNPAQRVGERGLARAVGADDTHDLTACKCQAESVQCADTAEGLVQSGSVEGRGWAGEACGGDGVLGKGGGPAS